MGRRWGKTTMAGACAVAWAAAGGSVAWVVPTYKNARPPWRFAEAAVAQVAKRLRINRTERLIEFPNNGRLSVYTADNPVGILGEAFDAVIVDEAARISEEVWTDAIQPTLADRDGIAMLISTPKGRNWFWREWQRGLDTPGYASFQAPTSDNPMPTIRRAAEMAQHRVSERTYRQEWLAEFVEDGGGVFRNVRAAIRPAPTGGRAVMGIDWGRDNDYTVIAVQDAETGHMLECQRFTGVHAEAQAGRIVALYERWKPEALIAERNSMGSPMIDLLFYHHGLPVQPFTTTQQSKTRIIDALALAFERGKVGILDLPWLIAELEAYQMLRTTVLGLPAYGAPEGMHDDGVMALALAWSGVLWANGGETP